MSTWYYADQDRQRQGPISNTELRDLFQQRRIGGDTLIWREGMPQWQPLTDFTGELTWLPAMATAPAAVPPPAAPAPAEDDRPLTGRAVFTAREPSYGQYEPPRMTQPNPAPVMAANESAIEAEPAFSPYAAPRAAVAAAPRAVAGAEVVYAGFWKRLAAYFIDSLVVGVIGGIIGAVFGGIMGALLGASGGLDSGGMLIIQAVSNLLGIVIGATYFAWFHSSVNQATPGKMAVGIKVVRSDGEGISFWRGVGRYFGFMISSLLLFIGLIMAAFTQRKQALHDLMCDTLVVDKWAFTHHPERQRHELGTVALVVLILGGLLTLVVVAAVIMVFVGLAATLGR